MLWSMLDLVITGSKSMFNKLLKEIVRSCLPGLIVDAFVNKNNL